MVISPKTWSLKLWTIDSWSEYVNYQTSSVVETAEVDWGPVVQGLVACFLDHISIREHLM